jgi:hypothetical protein
VPKLVQKLIRKEGRGENAPALPRLNFLLGPLGGNNRKSLFAGAGVVATAAVVVSFLTWLAPDSDRPIPLQMIDRVLPGVAEQVEEQAATLIEGSKETVQNSVRNVREGLAGAGSGIARLANASSSLVAPSPATPPRPNTAMPTSEEPLLSTDETSPLRTVGISSSSTTTDASPPITSEPTTSAPAAEKSPAVTEEPAPATEEPPAVTEEPAPVTEDPPPPKEEPPPATENSPPATEKPPARTGEPPPTRDELTPPPTEEPPSATNPPPPATSQPPPPSANESTSP